MTRPALISLFCGPGGLDLGFYQAGFRTLYAADISRAAVQTHLFNHPEAKATIEDLRELTVNGLIAEWEKRAPGVRPAGLIGGPPCQSFSYANTNQSEEDDRHTLPGHYARLLKGLNEHWGLDFFLFENVLGLIGKHREKYEHFKTQFADAGFEVNEQVLEAKDYGVPQLRPRVFIVGINRTRNQRFHFPQPTHLMRRPPTVRDAIWHLRDMPVEFFSRDLREHPVMNPVHVNHWTTTPKSSKFADGTLARTGKFGKSFAVLDWDKPSLTVAYGHREIHVHPDGRRRLTIYEAMLLQGFPASYQMKGTLSDQVTLVSEVVSPPVARAIAAELYHQLGYGAQAQVAAAAQVQTG